VEEAPTMNRDAGIGLLRRTPSRLGAAQHPGPRAPGCRLPLGAEEKSWSSASGALNRSIVWAAVTSGYRHVLRHLLEQASRRRGEKE
jgi:hypothetical protein